MAHSDEKADRALIRKMVKPAARKMSGGGKTNANMLKYGRNMAKIKAQRGG
jgi:hypothetical protein